MPDGEFEFTDISIKDFDTALQTYLARLEREEKAKTPAWTKMANVIAPSWLLPGMENIGEKYDRMYAEIMDAVDLYGLSPAIARILPNDSASIFNTTLTNRASYEWNKTFEENVTKWAADVVKLQAKSFGQQLDVAKFEFTQQQAGLRQQEAGARLEEEQRQFDFLQKRDVQRGMFAGERLRQQGILGQQQIVQQQLAARGRQEPRILEAEKSRIFEDARRELLGGLTGAENWIKRWEAKNKPNPFQQTSREVRQGNIDAVREEVKGLKEAASIIQKRQKDPSDPLFLNVDRPDVATSPEQQYAIGIMSRLHTAEDKLLEFTAPNRAEIEAAEITGVDPAKIGGLAVRFASNRGDPEFANMTIEEQKALTSVALEAGFSTVPEPARPTTPPTPSFISKLFPSQAGNLSVANIGRVSGQAFGRLTPSQQQGLLGFAEFQGMEPSEILPQFTQRRPGPRWQPSSQRISV